jgi:hypothetical protein
MKDQVIVIFVMVLVNMNTPYQHNYVPIMNLEPKHLVELKQSCNKIGKESQNKVTLRFETYPSFHPFIC